MKIFIKRANGLQQIIIECDANGLIQHLKGEIQTREKIKLASQLLFYEQQELEDHKTLKFYGIPDLATIELKVVGNNRKSLGSNRSLFYLRKKWSSQRNKERTFHKDLTLPKEELLPSGCKSIQALRNQYQKQKDERAAKGLSSWTSDIQSSPILAVAISSDSKFFASGYEDGSVKIFDMQTKKLIYCFTERIKHSVKALKVSDNSQVLVCGFEDGSLRAYEINSFKILYEVQAHGEEILSLIITMDNKCIISTSLDSSIKIWNLEDGEEIAHITNVYQMKGRGGSITVSEDRKYIIAGSKEGSIKVFDFETRSELYHFQNVQSGPISSLAITSDNKKILSSSEDGSIKVFNLELKSETHCFEQIHSKNTLNLMVLSSDNRFLISSGKGELLNIINLEMNMVIQNIESSQEEQILSLAISEDNQYIISGSKENRIMMFDFIKKPESYDFDFGLFPSAQVCDIIVTNQNKYIVLFTAESIKVFDFKTKTELCTFGNSPQEAVKSFDITSDSRYIVAALADSSIKILDIKTEGMIHQIQSEQTKIVSQIKLSGDDKNILVVYAQVSLAVIEFETNNTYCHFKNAHEGVIESITWSNDNKFVISGSKDKSIKVFDIMAKNLMYHFKDAHKTCIYSLSLTPDNKHLISGSEEGSIKIFDLESNREVHYFDKIFRDRVSFLSVSNDSNFIISVSSDCSVKVFDLLTKSEVYNLLNFSEQNDLSLETISQDGRYLFARSKDARINILSLPVIDNNGLTFVSDKISSLHSFGNYDNIILQNLHNASFLQSFQDFYTLPHRWNVLHLLAIFQPSDVPKMISYADFRVPFLIDQHNKTPLHYLIAQPKIDYNSATFMLKYIIDYLEDTSRRTFAEYEAVCASLSNIMPFIVLKINTKLVCNLLKLFFVQTPPCYGDTLPDFGLPEKKCAFSKTPVLQREIKEKIFIDGEEQIAFRSALLHLDYDLNSDDLFETVSYLNYVKDEDVFKAPVIEHLINYLWDKTYTFLITLGAVFSLLMILISIYVGLGERNLGLEIIIFIITVGILIGEAVQIKTLKKNFTNHFWNWVDLSHIILVFAFIIWRFTDDEEELSRGWLSSIIIIIGYIRWISYLRLFNKTKNLIQIIISIIKDMVGFMLVLIFITIGFSLVFLEFNRDTDYSGHIYDTYKLLYGDLDDDEFSISQKLLLAFILFMLNVVLLNLLISIMGDSYDKTQERKVLTDSLTRLESSAGKKNNNRGYLIFCEPMTLQEEGDSISTEWEGRVNIIKKMLRQSEYKVGQEVSQVRQEVRRVEQKVQGLESLMLKHHQEMLDIMKDRHGSKDLICN